MSTTFCFLYAHVCIHLLARTLMHRFSSTGIVTVTVTPHLAIGGSLIRDADKCWVPVRRATWPHTYRVCIAHASCVCKIAFFALLSVSHAKQLINPSWLFSFSMSLVMQLFVCVSVCHSQLGTNPGATKG